MKGRDFITLGVGVAVWLGIIGLVATAVERRPYTTYAALIALGLVILAVRKGYASPEDTLRYEGGVVEAGRFLKAVFSNGPTLSLLGMLLVGEFLPLFTTLGYRWVFIWACAYGVGYATGRKVQQEWGLLFWETVPGALLGRSLATLGMPPSGWEAKREQP